MIKSERENQILELIEKKGYVSVKETAELLFTSESSIRRDFTELEKAWDIIKSFEVEIAKIINAGNMEALEEFCEIIESGDRLERYKFLEKWV